MMTYLFTIRLRSIVSLLLLVIAPLTDACHGPYVTASSVEALHQDIHLVRPLPVDCGGLSCEFYLSAQSALGAHGPISAYGPLGTMGPIGRQFWNPTTWRGSLQKKVENEATPILFESSDNPLSSAGPLSWKAYHETLPSINDFSKHLQGLGLWGVLGPLGPLGGLGPLGALGPTGPYNTMNLEGHHSVPVRWNKTSVRHFDLVNVLDTWHVKEPLGCSFMILGHITRRGKIDSYYFECEPNQFITIVLVPEHSPDHFNMTLYSAGNDSSEPIASSQSADLINFIQLAFTNANLNGSFRIDVNLHDQDSFFVSHTYRLTVTGSQDLLDLREEEGNIRGPHIIDCDK